MSLRKDLRATAIAALRADLSTIADARITGARMYPHNMDALPAIEVSTPESTQGAPTLGSRLEDRVALQVSIFAASEDAEDDLDDIADAVEASLRGSADLTALLRDLMVVGTRFFEGEGGDSRPARLDMTFACAGRRR